MPGGRQSFSAATPAAEIVVPKAGGAAGWRLPGEAGYEYVQTVVKGRVKTATPKQALEIIGQVIAEPEIIAQVIAKPEIVNQGGLCSLQSGQGLAASGRTVFISDDDILKLLSLMIN